MTQSSERLLLTFTVFEDQLELVEGMIPFHKSVTFPFKDIAKVEVRKSSQQFVITMKDGREHMFTIGEFGKAQAAREAVAESL